MRINRLTLLNLLILAFFVGTFLSPLIYSGLRRTFMMDQMVGARNLTEEDQHALILLENSYQNVYRVASPSVVYIRTNVLIKPRFFFDYYRRVEGAGSGFLIDRDGYIVTNNHVVSGAQEIEVIFHDDTRAQAKLVGRDESSDVALIKVPPSERYQEAMIGNSDKVEPGQLVFALGAPFGLDRSFTQGIISANNRYIDNSRYTRIQTDAAINQGNSGGPLLNIYGEVVGINQSILSAGNGGNLGIGFAIPINDALKVIEQLKKEKRVIGRPSLGVSVVAPGSAYRDYFGIPRELPGVVIRFVIPGSAADRAGLAENDLLTKANGKVLHNPETLIEEIQRLGVGGELKLELLRSGQPMTLIAIVGEENSGQ